MTSHHPTGPQRALPTKGGQQRRAYSFLRHLLSVSWRRVTPGPASKLRSSGQNEGARIHAPRDCLFSCLTPLPPKSSSTATAPRKLSLITCGSYFSLFGHLLVPLLACAVPPQPGPSRSTREPLLMNPKSK